MFKQKTEDALYSLYWGFKIVPFTLYTYVLAKVLQIGAKFIQKTDSWFKKSHEDFGKFQMSSRKS